MISKLFICPSCKSEKHLVLMARLLNDAEYEKKLKCRKCEWEWCERLSLVSDGNTYVYIWDSTKKISAPLHRWVWEQSNGRSLSAVEVIHHKNRNRGDNRMSNLTLMDRYSHNVRFNNNPTCKRCGHGWYPTQPEIRICPKCKSPYWDKERQV